MAYYLVQAKLVDELLPELRQRLDSGDFQVMRPFGQALQYSLENARIQENGRVICEEEDYCSPPFAQERAAVLDRYFEELDVERVERDRHITQVVGLLALFEAYFS